MKLTYNVTVDLVGDETWERQVHTGNRLVTYRVESLVWQVGKDYAVLYAYRVFSNRIAKNPMYLSEPLEKLPEHVRSRLYGIAVTDESETRAAEAAIRNIVGGTPYVPRQGRRAMGPEGPRSLPDSPPPAGSPEPPDLGPESWGGGDE